MKTLFSIFLTLSCHPIFAQLNQEVTTDDGKTFLLGKVTIDRLQSKPYEHWFNSGYENYSVDETLVNFFQETLSGYHVKVFLGTWCGDSKREVPRFYKILKAAQYPMKNLQLIALDRRKETYKTSPAGEDWGLNIVKVPTFIFLKNGREVNRIIESPLESLEEDMVSILSEKAYTPNYADLVKSK